jgi:flagellar L-ring protein precursor FlgH
MASCWSSSSRPRPGAAACTLVLLTAVAVGTSGCLQMYLKRPAAPVLAVVPPPPPSPRAAATGSLWRDDVSANYLFADTRARFPGDLITILITEDSSGSKEAGTSTSTDTSVFGNLEEFFGLPQQVAQHNPTINPAALVKAEAKRTWDGEGSTSRKGKLTARMTATVKNVSPTGNLLIQGEKVIAVNKEDQHIVVQGWVRPEDIDAENQVLSTRLADARIDYYGVGVVGAKQREGWGLFLLDLVWPF